MTAGQSMVRRWWPRLWRRAGREDGNATIEFVILFPLFLTLLASSAEIGMITYRHTMLERAVDLTVRDIRLGTGTAPQYTQIRNTICDRAPVIPNCQSNMKLEMIRMDLRNYVAPPAEFDCIDKAEEVQPVRTFQNGMENEMILLRVCAMFEPLFPFTGLGRDLKESTDTGFVAMVSSTAFVQEPK